MISLLLYYGADPFVVDKNRRTPLMHAISRKSIVLTRLLLQAGSDCNARDANQKTALIMAVESEFRNLSDFYLHSGQIRMLQTVKVLLL